jgi:homogentisate 1,2-dioxygenase
MAAGELAEKHHVALRGPGGALRYEQCLTRGGFEGAYTIAYHLAPPQTLEHVRSVQGPASAQHEHVALRRRHFRAHRGLVAPHPASGLHASWLHSTELSVAVIERATDDTTYVVNADADELWFIAEGRGAVHSAFGELSFGPHDYVCIPKGVVHRVCVAQRVMGLAIQCDDLHVPSQFRNALGQLRMDAPYSHRDFRRPAFQGPCDEGLRELRVQRRGDAHFFRLQHSPLDAVGWDGTVYPWAFPMSAFQPRVGSVHLPPTWHGTFAAKGALICSFVPRPLDFHPNAIPCPYPHASVDVDEVIYYVSGALTSRSGIEVGSLTLHPRGIPHGPQPGRYEASIGQTHTEEIAVMLDCYAPLHVGAAAEAVEDADYESSFGGGAARI